MDEWKIPLGNGQYGTNDFWATDDFEVVNVVADANGTFVADRLLATVDDGTCWSYGTPFALNPADCTVPNLPLATVRVGGQVAQTGRVWIGGASAYGNGQWNYDLETSLGVHDIIAVTTLGPDTYSTIRREHDLAVDTMEAQIDGVAEGQKLELTPVALSGAEADAVAMTTVTLSTVHDSAVVSKSVEASSAFSVEVAPSVLLIGSDHQTLDIVSESSVARRGARVRITATPINLELMSLPDVSYVLGATSSASWTEIVSGEQGGVFVLTAANSTQQVAATERWLESYSHRLSVDAEIADYLPAWRIDTAAPFTRTFALWRDSGSVRYSVEETASGP